MKKWLWVVMPLLSMSANAGNVNVQCDATPLSAQIGYKEKIPSEAGGAEDGWVRRSTAVPRDGCVYSLSQESQFIVFTFPKTVKKTIYDSKCTFLDSGEPVPHHFKALSKEGVLNGADIIIQCPADKVRYPEACSYKKRRLRHSEDYLQALGADKIMVNYGLKVMDPTRPGSEQYVGRKQFCVLQKKNSRPGVALAAFVIDGRYPSWHEGASEAPVAGGEEQAEAEREQEAARQAASEEEARARQAAEAQKEAEAQARQDDARSAREALREARRKAREEARR